MDGFLFLIIRFSEHVFIESHKLFFQVHVLFQDGAVISFESYDLVSHSVLESGMVKEGSISFPLSKPVNFGLLLPKKFFLFTALIEAKQ